MTVADFILAFTKQNPFLSVCVLGSVYYGWKYPWLVLKRSIRSKDIQKHGWPTAPIDADGDVVTPTPAPRLGGDD